MKLENKKRDDRKEQILDATEDLLRRHGIAKTAVVDVAQALGISHAAVYGYFPTKVALQEAVCERWLHRISNPLELIVTENAPADARLRKWMFALVRSKRRRLINEPELFRTYMTLTATMDGVADAHITEMLRQIARIVEDGVTAGIFKVENAKLAAGAVLAATTQFHHPYFVMQVAGTNQEKQLNLVMALMMAGMKAEV